jgi:hypothetical protein
MRRRRRATSESPLIAQVCEPTGVSNRNGAYALRNRIFLGITRRIFVATARICNAFLARDVANHPIRELRITESQMPSPRFSASLTARGLALLPVDFIT